MVDMRVGQHHRIDLARIEAEGPGVQPFQRARSLEQAAIDQHPRVAQVNSWQDPVTVRAAPWKRSFNELLMRAPCPSPGRLTRAEVKFGGASETAPAG
jgi:hypothetical protein